MDSPKEIQQTLDFYKVEYGTAEWSQTKCRLTTDYEYAKDIFDNITNSDVDNISAYKTIIKFTYTYKFIYDLDDEYESIDDYPLIEYYENENVWKLVDEESDHIESEDIKSTTQILDEEKKTAKQIMQEVILHFKSIYDYTIGGYFTRQSAYFIVPIPNTDNNIEVRISDHSFNPSNIKHYIVTESEFVRKTEKPKNIDISKDYTIEVDDNFVTYKQTKPKNLVAFLSNVIYFSENDTYQKFKLSDNSEIDFDIYEYEYDLSTDYENYEAEDLINTIQKNINEWINDFSPQQKPLTNIKMANKNLTNDELQLINEITNDIKQVCTKSKYYHLCKRVNTDSGMAYVVNRCIKMMANSRISLSTALADLETEFEGIN